jgi:flagellin-like protein
MTKKIGQKIRKIWKDKTGVSPIISVILMVAITVVLAATIWAWVSGFGGSGSEPESAAVVAKGVNDRLRIILAEGGESYPEGGYLNGDYGVWINGEATNLTGEGTWMVGESLTFTEEADGLTDLTPGVEYSVTVTIFDTTVFDKDILITG